MFSHDSNLPQSLLHLYLESAGLKVAYLHAVEVNMDGELDASVDMQQIRGAFDGLYIANGGYDKARGTHSIESNMADMIAYGVNFLANPDLPERFKQDAMLNEADQNSFYGGDEHGYTDYPTLAMLSSE